MHVSLIGTLINVAIHFMQAHLFSQNSRVVKAFVVTLKPARVMWGTMWIQKPHKAVRVTLYAPLLKDQVLCQMKVKIELSYLPFTILSKQPFVKDVSFMKNVINKQISFMQIHLLSHDSKIGKDFCNQVGQPYLMSGSAWIRRPLKLVSPALHACLVKDQLFCQLKVNIAFCFLPFVVLNRQPFV